MPDWLFHWTHDEVFKEVLKVSIPALGSILAALIAWYGIRRTAKVTQETLENSKEATPPELLRLEKWLTILKDSEQYPENLKNGLDVKRISNTYNDVLKWATLENRVMNLGISSPEIRQALLQIKPGDGDGTYPKQSWKIFKDKVDTIMAALIFSSAIVPVYLTVITFNDLKKLKEAIFQGQIISILNIIMIFSTYDNSFFHLVSIILFNLEDLY